MRYEEIEMYFMGGSSMFRACTYIYIIQKGDSCRLSRVIEIRIRLTPNAVLLFKERKSHFRCVCVRVGFST